MFKHEGELYRQVNEVYAPEFIAATSSGLFEALIGKGLLVPFQVADIGLAPQPGAHSVLKPSVVSMVSYPYEWSFSQLKDAALLTLSILRECLERGFVLKDATAYNVQFHDGRPIFIDHLSFELYKEGEPWVAYRQFCEHFLSPLALMSLVDIRFGPFQRIYLDGIPLDFCSKLLPMSSKFRTGLMAHIHLHSSALANRTSRNSGAARVPRVAFMALIHSLEKTVEGLEWTPKGTEWADYYDETNYTELATESKCSIVSEFLEATRLTEGTCWDFGANTGAYSETALRMGLNTVVWDLDPAALEKAYVRSKSSPGARVLPLLVNLANPSPSLGWDLHERDSLVDRGPADVVMALALAHHLAIGNNLPLGRIASFLAENSRFLIIEFVPKEDSQVQRMLMSRKDIFTDYSQDSFERALGEHFEILQKREVMESVRTIYLMSRKRGR